MRFKENYILLGAFISFVIIAIIQWCISGTLPVLLYVTIAFLSLQFTIFECIKALLNILMVTRENFEQIKRQETIRLTDIIHVMQNHPKLHNELENSKKQLKKIKELKIKKNQVLILKRVVNVISILQIVLYIVLFSLIPLKVVPYDLFTTKVINILTLLAFAFMFLSLYLSNIPNTLNDKYKQYEMLQKNSEYYMEIIKMKTNGERVNESDI